MKLDQLIRMVSNILIRKAVNWGIGKGTRLAAGKGKPASQMTPEERRLEKTARQAAKTARKAARVTRRMR